MKGLQCGDSCQWGESQGVVGGAGGYLKTDRHSPLSADTDCHTKKVWGGGGGGLIWKRKA